MAKAKKTKTAAADEVRVALVARYATAIIDTRDRHRRGCMGFGTYKSHVASLWGTVGHLGLKADVELVIATRDGEYSLRVH